MLVLLIHFMLQHVHVATLPNNIVGKTVLQLLTGQQVGKTVLQLLTGQQVGKTVLQLLTT